MLPRTLMSKNASNEKRHHVSDSYTDKKRPVGSKRCKDKN